MNSELAISFLLRWAPEGPWVITAIDPERKKGLVGQTFDLHSLKEATAFIEQWNGKRNLYFMVNSAGKTITGKAEKDDIAFVNALHVDVDPSPPPKGVDSEEHYAKERQTILERFASFSPPPSVILFSGGGYQGFWRLAEPLEVEKNAEKFEAYNKKLEKELGGDHCHNLDRIMRLPGTINIPDARKRAKGRVTAEASIIHADWDRFYTLDDFEPYVEEKKRKKSNKDDKWLERVIANGPDHEGKFSFDNDRSKAVWAVCCALIRKNVPVEDIVEIITNKENKISEHVLDQSNPKRYALKQAEKAYEEAGGDFIFSKDGFPAPLPQNVRVALSKLGIRMRYNEFSRQTLIDDGVKAKALGDVEFGKIYLRMLEEFSLKVPENLCEMVLNDEAQNNPFHPVKEYLASLKWDGVKRIDTWLIDYGKADDKEFIRAVGKLVLVAAVRRIRSPGCKFDEILVMESPQGFQKSTALLTLAVKSEWFTDSLPLSADEKKIIEALSGKWIVEAPELKGMRRTEVEHHKAMLSRQVDRSRMSYDRFTSEVPRQCIFFGTTNAASYLRDTTGNRRFWPVKVGVFDIEGLRKVVDQLWAEAAVYEADGMSIRLAPELYPQATEEQEQRKLSDPWEEIIKKALNGYDTGKIHNHDVWQIINVPIQLQNQEFMGRIAESMRSLGWEAKQARINGKVANCYVKGNKNERQARINILRDDRGLHVDRDGDLPEFAQGGFEEFEP